MKRSLLIILSVLLVLPTGCQSPAAIAPTVPAETTAASSTAPTVPAETTTPSSTAALSRPDGESVYLALTSTETGDYQYWELPQQEQAIAVLQLADTVESDQRIILEGESCTGLILVWKQEYWEFLSSGALINLGALWGRVSPEDAAELYACCQDFARDLGWQEAVTPDQIQDLCGALLKSGEWESRLTDADALKTLEAMLHASEPYIGRPSCPFGPQLTLTTRSGSQLTISLAVDSCGSWLSQGVYYTYASDSLPLFQLLGAEELLP